jgi:hypothetical protein
MLKSIGVVVGSYVLSVVLVICTDPLLSAIFPGQFAKGSVPSNTALAASTGCFTAISIFCAWLCARFAPSRPARHVLWLFVVGEAMGAGATIANWNSGFPHWYSIAWMISWPITCFLGLRFAGRASPSAASSPS